MEGMKQFISLDENNKLLIRGNAIISEKGIIPSFDGEFVMYGSDVQRLMVLLNEGNYLRREEIQLQSGDDLFGYCGWNTFAILKDEQVAEMLKKQDATIKQLSDNVKARIECEKTLIAKIDMLKAENKVLKKKNEEFHQCVEKLETRLGRNVVDEPHGGSSKGVINRFFGWFKKKK